MSAEQVARAEHELKQASTRHASAVEKVNSIRGRIEWSQARQQAITASRLNGSASDADNAEFSALDGDLTSLKTMLVEAEAAANALDPVDARSRLAMAKAQHEREQLDAEYQAVSAKATELDLALCRAIAAAHALGRRLGHVSLSQSWRPSTELDRAQRLGVCPSIGG